VHGVDVTFAPMDLGVCVASKIDEAGDYARRCEELG
jgi:hypothetical protein